ncbi:hypothetical protein TARUN_8974 [Trichoderma arundinaceum]|uniref:Uncharacterized protein n=1 Tax=Trichoderma arundinaceum TaxID=490622 RepID=A0A395NB05_TRIAR|nr:hypothetical protein TARUN_8974 [Trichoderma arundinaceum]
MPRSKLARRGSSLDNAMGVKLAGADAAKSQLSVDNARASAGEHKKMLLRALRSGIQVKSRGEGGRRRAREQSWRWRLEAASWLAGLVRWLAALAASEQRYWRRC